MSRTTNTPYSIVLNPTGYAGNSGLTAVSGYGYENGQNAASNTSNHARLRPSSANTTGYVYYTFTLPDIPSTASNITVSAVARGRLGNGSYISGTIQLYSNTTAIGNATSITGTTVTTFNISNTDFTRSQLTNLRLRVNATTTRTGSNYHVRFYGADVTINYTVQETEYEITASVNQYATLSPTDEFVKSGDSFTLIITPTDGSSAPTSVTDNNIDVTNSLQILSGGTKIVNLSDYTGNTNFTLTDISNAYNSSSNTSNYATLDIAGGSTTGSIYFTFSDLNIPSVATILSCSASAAIQFSRNGSSSGVTASCQMYSGTTAKGSSQTITTSATDVARTVYNFTMGTWTASELNNARLYITCTNSASSTHRYIYVYGADLSVTYEIDGYIYTYTISNVQADHTIVVTYASGPSYNIYVKQNGSWVKGTLYVKDSNTWKEASSILVKDNGTWK